MIVWPGCGSHHRVMSPEDHLLKAPHRRAAGQYSQKLAGPLLPGILMLGGDGKQQTLIPPVLLEPD